MLHTLTLGLFAFESWHDPVSERRREPGKIQAEVAQALVTLGITGWLAREHCLGSTAADRGLTTSSRTLRSTSTLFVPKIAVSSVSLSLNGLESGAAMDLLLRNGCFAAVGETFRAFVYRLLHPKQHLGATHSGKRCHLSSNRRDALGFNLHIPYFSSRAQSLCWLRVAGISEPARIFCGPNYAQSCI